MTKARWATPDDLTKFYGLPISHTVQAVVLDVGGEILAVAGIYEHSGRLICFSDFKEEASSFKKTIISGARMMRSIMAKKRRPIYAVRDENLATSARFLAYLGFEQDGEYYVWHS